MNFALEAQIKDRFFDRAAVVAMVARKERMALSRMGAFIRQRAKTDVLRRGSKGKRSNRRASTPGGPPLVHSRNAFATLRNILFALGPDGQTVVVGPRAIPSLRLRRSSAKTVPELLEFGGTATVQQTTFPSGQIVMGDKSGEIIGARVTDVTANYAARPFMSVALEREAAAGTLVDAFSFGVNR